MHTSLSLDSRYDELVVSLRQIDALLEIATSADLSEIKSETITNYFWVISDVLTKAKNTCDNLATVATCSQPALEENKSR